MSIMHPFLHSFLHPAHALRQRPDGDEEGDHGGHDEPDEPDTGDIDDTPDTAK